MKTKALAAALFLVAGTASAISAVPSGLTVSWHNNATNTKHVGTFNNTPTSSSFVDHFTFNVTDTFDAAGANVSSQMNKVGLLTSNLNFSSVVISGNGHSYALTQTAVDTPTLPEVWKLTTPAILSHGSYTMTFTGTTTGNAKYAGSLTLVSSVPEPETYSMVLLGIGLVGFSVRRRKPANFA